MRLYSSSISCALLITPISVFVEQYTYGRSNDAGDFPVLGRDSPVVELDISDDNRTLETKILLSSFSVVWNSYSVTLDQYNKKDERIEFDNNLKRLLEELSINPI